MWVGSLRGGAGPGRGGISQWVELRGRANDCGRERCELGGAEWEGFVKTEAVLRGGGGTGAEGVGRTLDPKWGGSAKMATAEEEPKPKKLKVEAPRALR